MTVSPPFSIGSTQRINTIDPRKNNFINQRNISILHSSRLVKRCFRGAATKDSRIMSPFFRPIPLWNAPACAQQVPFYLFFNDKKAHFQKNKKNLTFFKKNFKKGLQFEKSCGIIAESMTWPLSQTAKTSPSHGEDMGSIPVGVTKKRTHCFCSAFFLC